MIKILGLALYGPLAASTRYRLGQYVEGLAGHGIDLQVRHLLGDAYLRRRFAGRSPQLAPLVASGLMRLRDLLQQKRYDAALLYCELMPLLPGAVESSLLRIPYVYDFDDAFYLKYRLRAGGALGSILGGKFDQVIRGAAQVTAGNSVLASYAARHNSCTNYLPTVVDTTRYAPSSRLAAQEVFTIGWVGSPSTAAYLEQLVEPLSALAREGGVRFVVVGGPAPSIPGVDVVELDWSESSEIQLINSFDVGVMPLPDTDWARGKCAFKLIQYMACGVPAVASPVGANKDVLSGECGLLASTPHEWVEALRTLRDQPSQRKSMGEAGRARVEEHYSLQHALPTLATVLRRAAGKD